MRDMHGKPERAVRPGRFTRPDRLPSLSISMGNFAPADTAGAKKERAPARSLKNI